jgi:hypothetical protein
MIAAVVQVSKLVWKLKTLRLSHSPTIIAGALSLRRCLDHWAAVCVFGISERSDFLQTIIEIPKAEAIGKGTATGLGLPPDTND